jgi:hypothetical protein
MRGNDDDCRRLKARLSARSPTRQTGNHLAHKERRQHRKWRKQDGHDHGHENCPSFINDGNPESLRQV